MSVQWSKSYTFTMASGVPQVTPPFSLAGVGCYSIQTKSTTVVSAAPWDIGTTYNIGDVVEYGGSYYVATIGNTGAQPDISADWSLYQCFVTIAFEGTSVDGDVVGQPLDASYAYITGITAIPTGPWSNTSGIPAFAYKWGRLNLVTQPSPNDAPGIVQVTITLQEV